MVTLAVNRGAPAGTRVKICGLTRPEYVSQAVAAGAGYLGFVFFAKSPRQVSIPLARDLVLRVPVGVAKVGLLVDATDDEIAAILAQVPLDMLQLHGKESPARVAKVRARFGLPVMKAIGVAVAADLAQIPAFEAVADQILVDAKAPKDAVLPGGNGLVFDWRLIAGREWARPWMLAGGLRPDNVTEAVRLTGARQVDVSSGVESAPGEKDAARMQAFVAAARA
ncbi:MAG TPA: phosphoribosylanthranilate isomerase [Paenirhodobacter sp.]